MLLANYLVAQRLIEVRGWAPPLYDPQWECPQPQPQRVCVWLMDDVLYRLSRQVLGGPALIRHHPPPAASAGQMLVRTRQPTPIIQRACFFMLGCDAQAQCIMQGVLLLLCR